MRLTLGTSILWVEGEISSNFFPVKICGNIHHTGSTTCPSGIGETKQNETNIDSNQMDFSMSVLSGLGSRHVDDLAGTALDDDVTVLPVSGCEHGESDVTNDRCLPQSRALHREGERSTCTDL